jgi:Membrane bound O-acyl transferase family
MNPAAKSETALGVRDPARHFGSIPGVIRDLRWLGWIPLIVLPLAALTLRSALPAWAFMWLLAAAIFTGCKWQTWWDSSAGRLPGHWKRSFAYLLLWPGMDAEEFLDTHAEPRRIQPHEWMAASAKTAAGAALISAGVRESFSSHFLVAGWLGMLGLVLLLHFGAFQLLALAWQRAGIHAEPIMQGPLESESLSELWGKRWNLGFRKLSHALVFRPLQKRFGTVIGTLGAFLASGLIHDLVISIPARAGYGLPTAYFLLQGFGVLAERSRTGRRLGLGRGLRGRLWAILVALGPVCCLFHPWFVTRVMVPFLRAIRL